MKHIASITTLTLVAAAGFADAAAPAAAPASAWSQSANLGFTSDYVWRGFSQNAGHTAVQGGFDIANTNGLSAGVWASNVTNTTTAAANLEVDLYANYGFKVAGIDASVGYIAYVYEGFSVANFQEVNVSATVAGITGKVSKEITSSSNNSNAAGYYYELGYNYNVPAVKDLVLGLHLGNSDVSSVGYDYSVALSYPVAGFSGTVAYSNGGKAISQITAVSLKKTF